jgi:serine protease
VREVRLLLAIALLFLLGGHPIRGQTPPTNPCVIVATAPDPDPPVFVPGEDFVPGEVYVTLASEDDYERFLANPPDSAQLGIEAALISVAPVIAGPRYRVLLRIELSGSVRNENEELLRVVTTQAVDALSRMPRVAHASLSYYFEGAQAVNDPCYISRQWHFFTFGESGPETSLGGIGLPQVWQVETGSADIVVAVLDSGFLFDSIDIEEANILDGYDFVDHKPKATDTGSETRMHGTSVATIIGGVGNNNFEGAASINWNVTILPVRVLGDELVGNLTAIEQGILYAIGEPVLDPNNPHTAITNDHPAHIVNISISRKLPGACPAEWQDAIDLAIARGVIVITAAGNLSANASEYAPGNCDGVINVASSDKDGNLAQHSNRGPEVDIMAPGIFVVSTGGPTAVAVPPGTSFAAPHVAGVAALALAYFGDPDDVVSRILNNAVPRTLEQCPQGSNPEADAGCGHGLLNAALVFGLGTNGP